MDFIPPFDSQGLLPPRDYKVTFEQLRTSVLVHGTGHSNTWDNVWRLQLVNNTEVLVKQLWAVGITEIYLDGSFVEEKDHPNDVDGYFVCDIADFSQIAQQLNNIDPHQIWTWDRTARKKHSVHDKPQLPMWHRYRVELYPHFNQFSGIVGKSGQPLEFPDAFRLTRSGVSKGIIKIVQGGDQA